MNSHETRKLHTFIRVRDFGLEHATDFAPNSLGTQLFATMSDIVDALERHATVEFAKDTSAKQATTSRTEAREDVIDLVQTLRRTSRPISRLIPGLEERFAEPASNRDQDLLSAAHASVDAAEANASEFISRELPADFVADMRRKIETFETAISDQSESIGQRVAAGAAIDMNIEKGREIIADLDPIVKNRYENQPDVLAQWTTVKHTERGPHRSSPSTASSTTTSTNIASSSAGPGSSASPATPGSSSNPSSGSSSPGSSGPATPTTGGAPAV